MAPARVRRVGDRRAARRSRPADRWRPGSGPPRRTRRRRRCASSSGPSATTTSMPSASARVRTTPMVCGRVSASSSSTCPVLMRPPGQGHRLGDRGRLVQQARAGGRQPGQVGDHGLEVEQRLQPALADLGLVGRVGGVPGRVLQHVAPDHRRGDGAVVAEADHRRSADGSGRRARAATASVSDSDQRGRQVAAAPVSRIASGIDCVDQLVEVGAGRARRASCPARRAAGRCAGRRTAAADRRSAVGVL